MTSDQENKLLSPEYKKFVDRVANIYTPTPLTPAKRVAFDRALEERLARRIHAPFFRPAAIVATACAVLLMWLILPHRDTNFSNKEQEPKTVAVTEEEVATPAGEATLLSYAYYNSELYGDESDGEEDTFLPDEYEALVTAFALPDA
jgi:hypothetical protein